MNQRLPLPPSASKAPLSHHLDFAASVDEVFADELRRLEHPGLGFAAVWPIHRGGETFALQLRLGLCEHCTKLHREFYCQNGDGSEPDTNAGRELELAVGRELTVRGWLQ